LTLFTSSISLFFHSVFSFQGTLLFCAYSYFHMHIFYFLFNVYFYLNTEN